MATRRKTTKTTAKTTAKKVEVPVVDEVKEETTAKTVEPDFVTVCLNFPFDLKYRVSVNGKEEVVVFKGNATALKGKAKGILPIGAFGITPNVPKAVWDYIVATRPDDEKIKKGLLFATTAAKADGAAAERAKTRHGFEPVKVKK